MRPPRLQAPVPRRAPRLLPAPSAARTVRPGALALLAGSLALAGALAGVLVTQGRGAASGGAPPPAERDQEFQSASLPPLPPGMTLAGIQAGDSLFHGRGGCFACHGAEAEGLPAAGSALTRGLGFIPTEWQPIDSVIAAGIPDVVTRSPIRMPARGARGDLSDREIIALGAYVWAISQVRGEPWPGGHTAHAGAVPAGSTAGTATRAMLRGAFQAR